MATITVLQGWQSAERIERNFSNVTGALKVEGADFINKEIYYITAGTDPSRITSATPTAVTQGQNTIALPSDLDTMASYNLGIYKQNDDGTDSDDPLQIIARGSSQEGYFIEGSNLTININNNQTLNIYYIPEVADLTNTNLSETFFVTSKYKELIRMGLLYQWSIFNRNSNIQSNYQAQYEALKDDYVSQIQRNSSVGVLVSSQY